MKRKRRFLKEVAGLDPIKRIGTLMEETAKEISEDRKLKNLKKKFRAIDRQHGKKASPVVQGGLPSLGKRQ